jgi:hypothetical protein
LECFLERTFCDGKKFHTHIHKSARAHSSSSFIVTNPANRLCMGSVQRM